jgi:hypothetical protein
MREHRDVIEVLGGRAQQRDAADIDLLDRFGVRRSALGYGGFKRIEIRRDRRDRRDRVFFGLGLMLGVVAIVENRPEHFGVQRLHASVEERWKTGHLAHVLRRNPVVLQILLRPAGSVDDGPALVQRTCEFHRSAFVRQ